MRSTLGRKEGRKTALSIRSRVGIERQRRGTIGSPNQVCAAIDKE
jgi:hypothetical protein